MSDGMILIWVRTFTDGRKISSDHLAEDNLSPSVKSRSTDHHLFLHFKMYLGGQHHVNDDAVKAIFLSKQMAVFCEDDIQKLIVRYDKCFNSNRNCVEK